ncbi:MAG: hypothetical protein F2806_00060 [Actinobacteria bacterium]|uniref:Unannotated protein n=2 Tax=freshwater metagenome TaxID=449393 RepID=A0A6J7EXT6_9ZZZZ|nr:hypothetical protein [Actinomycetota bacterium]
MSKNADSSTRGFFPAVVGKDLAGRSFLLPAELPSDRTIAVVAFRQGQQSQVDDWIKALASRGICDSPVDQRADEPVVIEIPVLPAKYAVVRRFIDGGMASSIKVPRVLARTITIYGQVNQFRQSLDLPTIENVSVICVDRSGRIFWKNTGSVTEQACDSLQAAIQKETGS